MDDLPAESLPATSRSVLRAEWSLHDHHGGDLRRAEHLAPGVDEMLPESVSAHAWCLLRRSDGGLRPRLFRGLPVAKSLAHRVDDLLAESLSRAAGRMLRCRDGRVHVDAMGQLHRSVSLAFRMDEM